MGQTSFFSHQEQDFDFTSTASELSLSLNDQERITKLGHSGGDHLERFCQLLFQKSFEEAYREIDESLFFNELSLLKQIEDQFYGRRIVTRKNWVCRCFAISQEEVRSISLGLTEEEALELVLTTLKAGSGCASCLEQLKQLTKEVCHKTPALDPVDEITPGPQAEEVSFQTPFALMLTVEKKMIELSIPGQVVSFKGGLLSLKDVADKDHEKLRQALSALDKNLKTLFL